MTITITPTICILILSIALPIWLLAFVSIYKLIRDKKARFYRGQLSELLAVIHGDGGYYQEKHGTAVAVEDAIGLWYAKGDSPE